MKTRTCSLPALSLFCAWAFTASSGSRAAGAAAFPLEHLPVAAPPFLSLHEQTGTLAMAAAQAKSRLGKRAARPASGSSPANGDFQFPSPFSSPSTSSSSSSPSPQFSGMRQAVQGLWGKLRQELWPTRPKAKGYSFDQRQRLDTLINEIIDPELRKCVTEQAFGWSQGWPTSRVSLLAAEVERAAPNVPPNIVGVLSALMRRCDQHIKDSNNQSTGRRRRRVRITRGTSQPTAGHDTGSNPNNAGTGNGERPRASSNGVYADWVDNWWEQPNAQQPRGDLRRKRQGNNNDGGSRGQELGDTISGERVRAAQDQLEQAWQHQQGEQPPPPPPSTTQFSVSELRQQHEPAAVVPAAEVLRYLEDVARGRRSLFAFASSGDINNNKNNGQRRIARPNVARGGHFWLPKM